MKTTQVEMTLDELREFQNYMKTKRKKKQVSCEDIPSGQRRYVWKITKDTIMSGDDTQVLIIKGKKEAGYIVRQLESRYKHKFYLEEVSPENIIKKQNQWQQKQ